MNILETGIEGLVIIEPKRFGDNRGYFEEVFNRKRFEDAGLPTDFVQDNHSLSKEVNTIRGLHFQTPPFAQDKLVWCPAGAILDVAVDLRPASKTYKSWFSIELTPDNGRQLFVPIGFAHGFRTLVPNSETFYKVTNFYSAEHDGGIMWSDPDVNVDWGLGVAAPVISDKDAKLPSLQDIGVVF